MKTKNSTKKKLAAFALPALLLSFGFYGMILWTGCGVNSGSVLVLGLMWVPAVSALFSKLMVDHSVRGMGWRIHAQSLPRLGIAYLLPLVLCGVVYGLAWSTGIITTGTSPVRCSAFCHGDGIYLCGGCPVRQSPELLAGRGASCEPQCVCTVHF